MAKTTEAAGGSSIDDIRFLPGTEKIDEERNKSRYQVSGKEKVEVKEEQEEEEVNAKADGMI